MDVVFVGHSYTRRMRNHYMGMHVGDDETRDIVGDRSAELAKALGISQHFEGAYTLSDKVIHARDLWDLIPSIHDIQPAIVNIAIGTNDLALLGKHDPNECLLLANTVLEFARATNAPVVIVEAILPRKKGISSTPTIFRQNATLYNSIIRNTVSISDTPATAYNKLRGFTYKYIDGKETERDIDDWSHDGIHMDTQERPRGADTPAPMRTYAQRVRQVVMSHIGRLLP